VGDAAGQRVGDGRADRPRRRAYEGCARGPRRLDGEARGHGRVGGLAGGAGRRAPRVAGGARAAAPEPRAAGAGGEGRRGRWPTARRRRGGRPVVPAPFGSRLLPTSPSVTPLATPAIPTPPPMALTRFSVRVPSMSASPAVEHRVGSGQSRVMEAC